MIDTMTIVRQLEAAKMPREQAEAVAGAIRDGASTSFAELATKSDLERVHAALEGDIEALRKDVQGQIDGLRKEVQGQIDGLRKDVDGLRKEVQGQIDGLRKEMYTELRLLEQRMTIKLGSMLVVAVGVTAALVRLL